MFDDFADVSVCKRQLTAAEMPRWMGWVPLGLAGRLMGWNLILKAIKPA